MKARQKMSVPKTISIAVGKLEEGNETLATANELQGPPNDLNDWGTGIIRFRDQYFTLLGLGFEAMKIKGYSHVLRLVYKPSRIPPYEVLDIVKIN